MSATASGADPSPTDVREVPVGVIDGQCAVPMLDLACEIHGNNDKRFTTGVSVESNAELLALSAPRDYFPKYLKVYSLCIGHAAIRAHGC